MCKILCITQISETYPDEKRIVYCYGAKLFSYRSPRIGIFEMLDVIEHY